MHKSAGTRPRSALSLWLFVFVTIASVIFLNVAPFIGLLTSTPKSDRFAAIGQMPPAPNNPVARVVEGVETQCVKPEIATIRARVQLCEASPALEDAIATKSPLPKKKSGGASAESESLPRRAPKQSSAALPFTAPSLPVPTPKRARSALSSSDAPPLPTRAPKEVRSRIAGRALEQTGRASWYSLDSITASGEKMDDALLTAAHNFLPFGTRVRVLNSANGRSIVVRINDRGPFVAGRIIDLSKAAAEALDVIAAGIADVRLNIIYDTVASAGGE